MTYLQRLKKRLDLQCNRMIRLKLLSLLRSLHQQLRSLSRTETNSVTEPVGTGTR